MQGSLAIMPLVTDGTLTELQPKHSNLLDALPLSKLFKALSEPLRLDVLRVLSADSFGVQELALLFSMPQPGMSHHLKILAQAGLVVSSRQGNSIFYRRTLLGNQTEFVEIKRVLFSSLDALALAYETMQCVQNIYVQRSSQSRSFFEKNAEKFLEHQGLLCTGEQYFESLCELIDALNLPKSSSVMEVGPGSGELLIELCKRFSCPTALDNSPKMLELAKANLPSKYSVNFIQGDLQQFVLSSVPMNLVVLNMVLHHMPSPLLAFKQLHSILRVGGYLVVADLCAHKQEWVKDSCGDVWLGFAPQDINKWALEAGFGEVQSQFLGLKNGFQIQLKMFCSLKSSSA